MTDQNDILKLMALDEEGLSIISANCQDAVLRLDDIGYVPKARRFALMINRFDWEQAYSEDKSRQLRRRRAALRFECVNNARHINFTSKKKDHVLKLLALKFEQGDAPSGFLSLIFSGESEIRLEVECIEVNLEDLGAIWETKSLPDHHIEDQETLS